MTEPAFIGVMLGVLIIVCFIASVFVRRDRRAIDPYAEAHGPDWAWRGVTHKPELDDPY